MTQSIYVSDYPNLSVWFNPFSWSAVDRAYGLGLYTLFVPEALALPVPLDDVGVYLQFNSIRGSAQIIRKFQDDRMVAPVKHISS